MKKGVVGGLVTLLGVVLLGTIFAFSGVINVGADSKNWGSVEWFLDRVMNRSVALRAANVEIPRLDKAELISEGASHYDAMCAGCHGAPGVDQAEYVRGLNPGPPKLAEMPVRGPAQLFWITKHGIEMTGMPAWGVNHEDEEIWSIVALIRQFEQMTPDEYAALVESSKHMKRKHRKEHARK